MTVEKNDPGNRLPERSCHDRTLRLEQGLRVERVGEESIVFDSAGRTLHRVTGVGVEALALLVDGIAPGEVPDTLARAVDDLVAAGVVYADSRWTRRRALQAGGLALTAATVTTFALANPAAAVSACLDTPTPPDSGSVGNRYTTPGTYTFKTGPSDTTLFVRLWGAGGGGGGGQLSWRAGAGGGGGAYVDGTVTVAPCSSYSFTVGEGGEGGRQSGAPNHQNGNEGGASSFVGATTLTALGGKGGGYATGTGANGGVGSGGTTNRSGGSSGGGNGFSSYQSGGGGGGAGSAANGSNGSTGGAGGAGGTGTTIEGFSTAGGKGGNNVYNSSGQTGTAPGGGGSGAGVHGGGSGWTGGKGGSGQVWVRV